MYWSVLGCVIGFEYVAEWAVSWYFRSSSLFVSQLILPGKTIQDSFLLHYQDPLLALPCSAADPRLLLPLCKPPPAIPSFTRDPDRRSTCVCKGQGMQLRPRAFPRGVGPRHRLPRTRPSGVYPRGRSPEYKYRCTAHRRRPCFRTHAVGFVFMALLRPGHHCIGRSAPKAIGPTCRYSASPDHAPAVKFSERLRVWGKYTLAAAGARA